MNNSEISANNTNNQQFENIQQKILSLAMWSFSFIFDFAILLSIFKSISKLVRIEFFILCCIGIYSILFKVIIILAYLIYFFNIMVFGSLSIGLIMFLTTNAYFIDSMIFFYYSLYHVTFLKRTKIFLLLSNTIKKPITLLIYLIGVLIFSICLSSVCIIRIMLQTRNLTISIELYQRECFAIAISQILIPSFFPSVVYFLATLITLYSRFRISLSKINHMNDSELKRFRRNFILFSKFLILGIVNIFYMIPKTLYSFLVANCIQCAEKLLILDFIGDIFFLMIPIALIIIHNIIRKTLKNILKKVFC